MNWINLKTEYSFGSVYGPVEQVVEILKKQGSDAAGIADIGGTWGFIQWEKNCLKNEIKPIFGVKLPVVLDLEEKDRRGAVCEMTFIALNNEGLKEIYKLTDLAYKQFFYTPRISAEQAYKTDKKDVAILTGIAPNLAHEWNYKQRYLYLQYSPDLPIVMRSFYMPAVAAIDNFYPKENDVQIYEPMVFNPNPGNRMDTKTTPQYIMNRKAWMKLMDERADEALMLMNKIIRSADAKLQKAPLIKFPESPNLMKICKAGAKRIGVDLKDKAYKKRLKMELKLILEKGYEDYFLVVADIISWAKDQGILVGPGRGSAGGSLVAYLMGITTVDPLKYDLIFERFIDINRSDLPDIDIDFPDDRRADVLKYISNKYGSENVAQIGNINRLKAKSALNQVSKSFGVDFDMLEKIKNVLVERTAGDSDVFDCLKDTFKTTKEGKALRKKFPHLKIAQKMEGHASHTGVHAAGVIVSNTPIVEYCGINSRDSKTLAMIDMREAEHLNLLKIDILGLRTLSILADVCKRVGMTHDDLYNLPDGDTDAYALLNSGRYTGIFQLEGKAAKALAGQMKIESIEDLAAISAVARPGPLQSGGAKRYIDSRKSKGKTEYSTKHKIFKKATKPTAGVIVYQEQVMRILKDLGQLSWKDTIFLRKQMSKTMGEEAFNKYQDVFVDGAMDNGLDKEESKDLWKTLVTFGKYGFNKSHSVAYSMISYWCAYLKAKHPMEFAVACLNHSKSDRDSIMLLRDLDKYEQIKHVPFDKGISRANWTYKKQTLYGGFETLAGLGKVKARKAIELIDQGLILTPGLMATIDKADTPFRYIYPASQIYGKYQKHKFYSEIESLSVDNQFYHIIGKVMEVMITDMNDLEAVSSNRFQVHKKLSIKIRIEDDTESIPCFVKNDDLHEMIRELKVDHDWIKIKGRYKVGQFAPYFLADEIDVITKEKK